MLIDKGFDQKLNYYVFHSFLTKGRKQEKSTNFLQIQFTFSSMQVI